MLRVTLSTLVYSCLDSEYERITLLFSHFTMIYSILPWQWLACLQASGPVELFFNYFAGVLRASAAGRPGHRDRQDKFIFLKSFAWAVVPVGPKRVQGPMRPFLPKRWEGGRCRFKSILRCGIII